MLKRCWAFVLGVAIQGVVVPGGAHAEDRTLPAFPGAEGAGALARGGRGGRVLLVTSLDDYRPGKEPIPGTLRAAIDTKGPRTIVFRTGGLIELKATLKITEPLVTIAGQTAPGDGICLKNYDLKIDGTHDVIVRHLRVRPGDVSGKQLDGLSVYLSKNVIVDHCSASWSIDETLSVTGEGCGIVTIQWCFITESLNDSAHPKHEHGFGSLIRTDGEVTFHHNLYAHHKTRCPRPGTYGSPPGILLDFRNNAIYNWIAPAGYSAEDSATLNYVGNYLKPGPSTRDREHIFKIGGHATRMFVADNRLEGYDEKGDPWRLIANVEPENQADRPFATKSVATDAATDALRRVLDQAGAFLPRRDPIDSRIVEHVRQGEGSVINSQQDVGGWPAYASGTPSSDTDEDGLPDDWERQHGLNPSDSSDQALDRDGDGYTNLEEFLNHVVLAPGR